MTLCSVSILASIRLEKAPGSSRPARNQQKYRLRTNSLWATPPLSPTCAWRCKKLIPPVVSPREAAGARAVSRLLSGPANREPRLTCTLHSVILIEGSAVLCLVQHSTIQFVPAVVPRLDLSVDEFRKPREKPHRRRSPGPLPGRTAHTRQPREFGRQARSFRSEARCLGAILARDREQPGRSKRRSRNLAPFRRAKPSSRPSVPQSSRVGSATSVPPSE